MKRLITALVLVLAAGQAFANTTVTGKTVDSQGSALSYAANGVVVRFELRYTDMTTFQKNPPRANSGVPVQNTKLDVKPASDGSFSASLLSNSDITPTGSWYHVYFLQNGRAYSEGDLPSLTGMAVNLNSTVYQNPPPVVPAPTGDTTYVRLDGTNAESFRGAGAYLYADAFPGATMARRTVAAAAACPSTGCTIDARQSADLTMDVAISLGSDSQPIKLLLPAGTITRSAGANFVYYNGSWVEGQGNCNGGYYSNCTVIQGPSTADTAFVYGGSNQPGYVHLKNFYLHQTASGAVGIDYSMAIKSTIDDVSVLSDAGTALIVGGTNACACYNEFRGNDFRAGQYGVKLLDTANQNAFYGGTIWSGGTAVYQRSVNGFNGTGSDNFYGVDTENTGTGYDIYANNDTILTPYMEAVAHAFILEPGARGNWIQGSGVYSGTVGADNVTDNSGNASNFYMGFDWPNGNAATFPKRFGITDRLLIGGNSFSIAPANQIFSLRNNYGGGYLPYDDLSFDYEGGPVSNGYVGHAGLALSHMSVTDLNAGDVVTTPLGQPSAPTLACSGSGSGTTYTYYLVAHTRYGVTIPSAAATIQCPNAPSSSYPITITPQNLNNIWDWDVLKGDTAHVLCAAVRFGYNAANCKDAGQATNAYTTPTRDTTADAKFAGAVGVGQTTVGKLPAASSSAGVMLTVTDSTAISAEGQACAGGSSSTALAWSNGSVWKCF